MSWAAVAAAAASVISGAMSNNSAKKSANAQIAGLQKGADTIDSYYQDAKGYLQPYMDSGLAGNSALMKLMQDPNSIKDSAAYQFRFGQGMDALDKSAAARGSLFSGAHSKDAMTFGQGLASQEYDNQWNRLFNLTNMGQQTAGGLGQLGMGAGNSLANLYGGMGQARGSMYGQQGANNANMMGSLGSIFGSIFGNSGSGGQGAISATAAWG